MKKTLALILAVVLALACFVACGGTETTTAPEGTTDTPATEKDYTLVVVVDSSVANDLKTTNYVLALVIDADNKIAAARFDCSEVKPELDDAGALVPVESVATKFEQGDEYAMTSGSWAKQTKAFEAAIVGKTAEEVANLDMTLVAGCTMPYTPASFKALVAEAFASTLKVTFKTSETITVGAAISTAVKSGKGGKVTVTADVAGTVLAGGKVVATMIDTAEQSFTIEEGALVAGDFAGTKNEQGDGYVMPAGAWYNQAKAYCASTVGKTVADLANLDTVSDALAAAGCTMQNTTAGYKATIIKAATAAR